MDDDDIIITAASPGDPTAGPGMIVTGVLTAVCVRMMKRVGKKAVLDGLISTYLNFAVRELGVENTYKSLKKGMESGDIEKIALAQAEEKGSA